MTASGARSDLAKAVVDLAQEREPAAPGEAHGGDGAGIELLLSELVVDANGEVVIFNDSGFRTLAVRTAATVVAEGQAEKHVTASGEDVSGFRYVRFDSGVTLYFPPGLELLLRSDRARPTA